MPFIACKLPHGLTIDHDGHRLTLLGANVGERLAQVSPNGDPNDNENRIAGFGVTRLDDRATEFFEKWRNDVTFVNGDPKKGKVRDGFPALENGSILGPFASIEDLRAEVQPLAASVVTGFEGLDPAVEAEKTGGVEPDKDAGKGGK